MKSYLYLSLVPEALIASMLPPVDFGSYMAIGTKKRSRGQAIFFALNGRGELPFDLSGLEERCAPHPDGQPKHSVYLGIYRVLERVPTAAIGNLYLVTPDGRVLEIEAAAEAAAEAASAATPGGRRFHLYQEICPLATRVASALAPAEFAAYVTDAGTPIYVPKICFVELQLGELADDPEHGSEPPLPYQALPHLRDCLVQLRDNPRKRTKTVDRTHPQSFAYRAVDTGVYLGDGRELRVYPFPSEEQLQSTHYLWWRSASIMGDFGEAQ